MRFKVIAVLSWLLGLCHLFVWLGWSDSQVQPGAAEIKQLWPLWTEECHGQGNWQGGEGDVAIKTIFCHLKCQMPDLINRENCRSTEFFAFSTTWKPLMCPDWFLRCLLIVWKCHWGVFESSPSVKLTNDASVTLCWQWYFWASRRRGFFLFWGWSVLVLPSSDSLFIWFWWSARRRWAYLPGRVLLRLCTEYRVKRYGSWIEWQKMR